MKFFDFPEKVYTGSLIRCDWDEIQGDILILSQTDDYIGNLISLDSESNRLSKEYFDLKYCKIKCSLYVTKRSLIKTIKDDGISKVQYLGRISEMNLYRLSKELILNWE